MAQSLDTPNQQLSAQGKPYNVTVGDTTAWGGTL
ncbi:hypothetical protein MSTE_01992 [Mycobacteroides stephanolepidis]|uniref:Uncharacterized protein n=1 Tax=[Mycobacterium] stephanolepidis TaxID=1520670 RepID=A0A1Z4EWH1_9MYCO|nr:hypothetical protein MSTE_01992 [[Mycobacterium] stephanolepidis]